jgi:hypothetical protein
MSSFGGGQTLAPWTLPLEVDTGGFVGGLREAEGFAGAMFGRMTAGAQNFGRALSAAVLPAKIALKALAAGAAVFGGAVVAASAKASKANRVLARSFDIAGDSSAKALGDFNAFAAELSDIAGVGENTIKMVGSLGATLGGLGGRDLQQASAAAIGLAARYEHLGVTAEEAARLLARASRGDFGGFRKLGIDLDDLSSGQEKYNRVLQIGIKGLEDAEDRSLTTSGGLRRIGEAVNQLLVSFGKMLGLGDGLGEVFAKVATWIDRGTEAIEKFTPIFRGLIDDFKEFLGIGEFKDLLDVEQFKIQIKRIINFASAEVEILMMRVRAQLGEAVVGALSILPDFLGIDEKQAMKMTQAAGLGGMEVGRVEAIRRGAGERDAILVQQARERSRQQADQRGQEEKEREKRRSDFQDRFSFESALGVAPPKAGGGGVDSIQTAIGNLRRTAVGDPALKVAEDQLSEQKRTTMGIMEIKNLLGQRRVVVT